MLIFLCFAWSDTRLVFQSFRAMNLWKLAFMHINYENHRWPIFLQMGIYVGNFIDVIINIRVVKVLKNIWIPTDKVICRVRFVVLFIAKKLTIFNLQCVLEQQKAYNNTKPILLLIAELMFTWHIKNTTNYILTIFHTFCYQTIHIMEASGR